jgi:hypothetical protein
MADDKKPEEGETASENLGKSIKTSLHEQVFGNDPDGGVNDTPRGAIGANVNILNPAVQPDGFGPMIHIGDSDRHH